MTTPRPPFRIVKLGHGQYALFGPDDLVWHQSIWECTHRKLCAELNAAYRLGLEAAYDLGRVRAAMAAQRMGVGG
jgi:hypothetical protein